MDFHNWIMDDWYMDIHVYKYTIMYILSISAIKDFPFLFLFVFL